MMKRSVALFAAVCVLFGAVVWRTVQAGTTFSVQALRQSHTRFLTVGTAQSGIYANGKEVCRTWFAGFFPADAPRYAVVILNEDGVSGAKDCAPVFERIVEQCQLFAVRN